MKHLIIVGARGWGREVYAAAIRTSAYRNGEYDVKGFLDSKIDALDGFNGDYPPIIGAPDDYQIQEDDVFFIALGEPKWRKYYAELMADKGAKFISIVSDNAFVNNTAVIGDGSFIARWACVSANVELGEHVIVHVFCDLGHDVKVGNFATIEAYSVMGGFSGIGEESVMHVRSTLRRKKKIGDRVEVGSPSLVVRNVKDDEHVFGIPAQKLKY